MSDRVTLLTHEGRLLAKTWQTNGEIKPYDEGKYFKHKVVAVKDIHDLSELLFKIESDTRTCIIRGSYIGDEKAKAVDPEYKPGRIRRTKELYEDLPLHFVLIEVDNFVPLTADPISEPVKAIDEYIFVHLPSPFHGISYHWQLSNSAGHAKNAGKLKAHVWFWLSTPYTSDQLKAWVTASKIEVDKSVFQTNQVHYTAAPIFEAGVKNPVPVRSGFALGVLGDEIDLVIDDDVISAAQSATGQLSRQQRLTNLASTDPRALLLHDKGMVKSIGKDRELRIECPRSAYHTTESGETSTIYYLPHTGGFASGRFVCKHEHCEGVSQTEFDTALGYTEDLFHDIAEKGIPEAKHLTTDQANAGRIVRHFRTRLMVSNGQWFVWTGTHWAQDEGDLYRCVCNLSKIIHDEADEWEAKEAKSTEEKEKNEKIAEALRNWAKKSEMRSTIEAARYLAEKMLTVSPDKLNCDQWALNCLNGTVDLRTGQLRTHNPDDYITRVIDIDYTPSAKAPIFESVLASVTLEKGINTKPLAAFLKRWFGYCATASTREQKFVVHYGAGRNGKSTINDIISNVLGDYAGTAAPGLLVSSAKDRHPTEIADLFGRRMVTAHESGDGNTLREDFVKQATGGDRIKARYMRADFFEFDPTHKLQLLTNHKPIIKGQDEGIWRRVLLVPYMARFGSPEEVAAGTATHLRDVRISEQLAHEKQGILTWLVEGATEWYRDGLNPPDSVLAASKDYQTDQDRMLQFVNERFELGAEYRVALSGYMNGAYSEYQFWCKENGFYPLSKQRMTAELERIVPHFRRVQAKESNHEGKRRDVMYLYGLRLAEAM